MKRCRKHSRIWFFRFCASCHKAKQAKEKEQRKVKEKAEKEKKDTEKDDFFFRVMGRKKTKNSN